MFDSFFIVEAKDMGNMFIVDIKTQDPFDNVTVEVLNVVHMN